MGRIDIVLADDHQIFLEGLKCLLGKVDNFNIKGIATNGIECLKMVKKINPHIVLLDLNLPGKDGLECLSIIKRHYVESKVLILTMYDEPKFVKKAMQEGMDGYILKSSSHKELLIAIDEVLSGNKYIGEGLSVGYVKGKNHKDQNRIPYEDNFKKKYNLTKREIEILLLITEAKSNKQIAQDLFISDQTVSVHRKNMMRKLGVGNTAGLIRFAFEKSIIS